MILRIDAQWNLHINQSFPARRAETIKVESFMWGDHTEEENDIDEAD